MRTGCGPERFACWPTLARLRSVAALDVSYSQATDRCYAAVVVTAADGHTVLETATAVAPSPFPYVPGLLSFREVPPLVQALDRLQTRPDVLLVDGQGRAHTERARQRPVIGCRRANDEGPGGPFLLCLLPFHLLP